jgi:DNA glycosylase AlkZ-like
VLPSLWEAVSGSLAVEWGVQRPDGGFEFTPEMARCWAWKDALPDQGLAAVGKHFGRWAALVAPRLIPPLYALTGRSGRPDDFRAVPLSALQHEVAEAVLAGGPLTGPELRGLLGAEKRPVDTAVVGLQRAFVLTNARLVEQRQGWGAIAVDLVARRWPLDDLPGAGDARRAVVGTVLAGAGEISAADLGGALGWRLRRAREALDELVERGEAALRDDGDLALYSRS